MVCLCPVSSSFCSEPPDSAICPSVGNDNSTVALFTSYDRPLFCPFYLAVACLSLSLWAPECLTAGGTLGKIPEAELHGNGRAEGTWVSSAGEVGRLNSGDETGSPASDTGKQSKALDGGMSA